MRLFAALLIVGLAACHSTQDSATSPSMDDDPAWKTHDVDPNAKIQLGVVDDSTAQRVKPGEHDLGAPKETARDGPEKWQDGDSLKKMMGAADVDGNNVAGVLATVVYVTESGERGGPRRTAFVIYSSDEGSDLMHQRPTPWRVIKAQTKAEMRKLLDDLRASGLDRLPSESQELNDPLGDERQVIVVRDGKRISYKRSATQKDASLFKTFRAVEQVLVTDAHDVTPYVQVQGRTDTEHFKPLNPDR